MVSCLCLDFLSKTISNMRLWRTRLNVTSSNNAIRFTSELSSINVVQCRGESVDSYITSLCSLVEHCEYGALTNEIIRDRIVVSILLSNLWEMPQLDADQTLEKAIMKAWQSVAVKHQQSVIRDKDSSTQPFQGPVKVIIKLVCPLGQRSKHRGTNQHSIGQPQSHKRVTT